MSRFKYQNLIKEIVGNNHFTADDIFVELKKKGHNTSMSTVYRTLDHMIDIGEFTSFSYARVGLYYERNKGFHAHLIDKERGIILDVDFDVNSFDFPEGFSLGENVVNFFGSWQGDIPAPGFNLLNFISRSDDKLNNQSKNSLSDEFSSDLDESKSNKENIKDGKKEEVIISKNTNKDQTDIMKIFEEF